LLLIEQIDFDKDYQEYSSIFEQWDGWAVPAMIVLPDTTFLYKKDQKIVSAISLYMAQSGSFAMMEWLVVNKKFNSKNRNIAIKSVIQHVINICKQKNIAFLFTSTNNQGLINRLVDQFDFKESDKQITNLIKVI